MSNEICIVSAFFNINREGWDRFERTSDEYLDYFFCWARLKNLLIVYVETEKLKNKILEFREEIGLKDKTIVHIIEDFRNIDFELYESIKKATENEIQKGARLFKKNPEVWNADYNYVMLLKMWCVQDAVSRGEAKGLVSWVDFGYNHGGDVIDKDSNFNFTWKYDFPKKINLFLIQQLDDKPMFDIVCTMDTYIMGTVIVGIDFLWNEFWLLVRSSMISLNDVGLTDDDQNIILMAYRKRPEIFETYLSNWQMQLKQFGGSHLLLKESNTRYSLVKKVYKRFIKLKICFNYAVRIFTYVRKKDVH